MAGGLRWFLHPGNSFWIMELGRGKWEEEVEVERRERDDIRVGDLAEKPISMERRGRERGRRERRRLRTGEAERRREG